MAAPVKFSAVFELHLNREVLNYAADNLLISVITQLLMSCVDYSFYIHFIFHDYYLHSNRVFQKLYKILGTVKHINTNHFYYVDFFLKFQKITIIQILYRQVLIKHSVVKLRMYIKFHTIYFLLVAFIVCSTLHTMYSLSTRFLHNK